MTAAMRRRNKAHGVGNVNLYGMEQHPRMLHTIMVKAGQYTVSEDILEGDAISTAGDQMQPANELAIGFYGVWSKYLNALRDQGLL